VSEATGRAVQAPHRVQAGNVWKCSKCGDFVWSDAPFCQHCRAVFVRVMPYTGLARQRRELCVAVFRVVVVLLIGAGLLWFLVIVPLVEPPGRVDLIRGRMMGIGGAEMFTPGVFDLSTFNGLRGFVDMSRKREQGTLIFVLNTTELVVLETQPPYSRVRLTEGEHAGKEVWISTETILLDSERPSPVPTRPRATPRPTRAPAPTAPAP
jgi:hypothetical protein